MNELVRKMRHPKERIYGTLMYVMGVVVWPLVALGAYEALLDRGLLLKLLPISFYVLAFILYLAIRHLFLRAYIFGHYVLVTPQQFPTVFDMVAQSSLEIGLSRAPATFIRNSSGVMNAAAVKLFGQRYVWLNSALLDADTDAQLRFIVGHELGHHAFGHLDRWRNFLKFPAHFVPFLGRAYSRARELSCDRIGAYLAHDLDASVGALQMLACGSARLNAQMNPVAFRNQERLVPPITGAILHVFSGYPRLTRRVEAVNAFFAGGAARDQAGYDNQASPAG